MSKIKLSDNFSYGRLIRFTLPSVIMLVCTSLYVIVDGFFVSNFVGGSAFEAVNFIMPYLMLLGCVGFMFGTGGGALIARLLGEGDKERANRTFTLVVVVSIISGFVLAIVGLLLLYPVAQLLGGQGELLEQSVQYGQIILLALPAYVLQYEFQCLFVTAEKPYWGLFLTIGAGVTNIALDALFIIVFNMGIAGAALATIIGQIVGGVVPLVYFSLRNNNSLLKFCKFRWDGKALLHTVTNGSSELMTNISVSIVSMLYNWQLLNYIGKDGIAAYGVLMYLSYIFMAIFMGYSVGSAPIISYHYGAGNKGELKSILKKSSVIITIISLLMFALAQLLAYPISVIFVSYSEEVVQLTVKAFRIFAFSFLICGIAVFGSSFFTALNNGLVSALISFLRTLVFQVIAVFTLPLIWGVDGIWISIVVAELMAFVATVVFILALRNKYGY